jgi:hypothetical protein
MARKTAAQLREEADRLEAEETKRDRMADAHRIPTCPECGGRSFRIDAYTIVSQSALFVEDPDENTKASDFDWDDDYESGDHTDQNQEATCNGCGANADEVLEAFGWTFYDEPQPRAKGVQK